jgi:ribonuclease T1
VIARALAVLLVALGAAMPVAAQRGVPAEPIGDVRLAQLPAETRQAIALIRKGGPYPYARDGVVFSNREGHLPRQKRGYYHEYTVKTPGERTRGARRIVAGASGELFYSEDHYNHFRRILE